MGGVSREDVDPVVSFPFKISRSDNIVTAGSCFAQHIARYLTKAEFQHYVAEPAHPLLSPEIAEAHNYGMFSARYGNIYTSRQLLQLLERAYGKFTPEEDSWAHGDRFVDPFRPSINPDGFRTVEELRLDRDQHLTKVKLAIRRAKVFVFTLGLTETWSNKKDGSVYPVCPGVSGGVFDPDKYGLLNFSVNEVVADMKRAIRIMRAKNPKVRIILTVSPVPLAATAEDRHVLVSTTVSKARLRVAADILCQVLPDVHYFPSFEIITGQHSRGDYFDDTLRNVTDDGVEHVMSLFFRHATDQSSAPPIPRRKRSSIVARQDRQRQRVSEVLCDEAQLDVA